MPNKLKVAIIGSGNIGIDPASERLVRATRVGVNKTQEEVGSYFCFWLYCRL